MPMRLTGIDHVGVVVDNLEDACELLEHGLGLQPQERLEREDLRSAFFACGDMRIEVIEITEPDARRARLGRGPARIEHIAFVADDLDATIIALNALGIQPLAPPRPSGENLTFWTDPDTSDGMMFQFIAPNATVGN
jgi:methylmalonyl-CoA/ethylmalonyl-CoA epimerase